jgi:hypothetical protein
MVWFVGCRHNVHVLIRRLGTAARIVGVLIRRSGRKGTGVRRLTTLLAAALAPLVMVTPAGAQMVSVKLPDGTCQTTGGGRFVPIPGFPGERIDRRLLTDIAWLEKRYPIFITDGYSLDPVHAANGEHPLGLAVDIIPDKSSGGTWAQITALANWAEPRQNHPIFPFRWVGYEGDAGHGIGNHLHLSWSHTDSTRGPGFPVRTVYTLRCPTPATTGQTAPPPSPAGGAVPDETPGNGKHRGHKGGGGHHHHGTSTGGIAGTGSTSGGVSARVNLAPVVPETGE